MNRSGEEGVTLPTRSKRFFDRDGYWYYTTREGVDIGPFDSLIEAETGASEFIDFIIHAEPSVVKTLERYGKVA